MQLEAVFAVLAGWAFLHEILSARALAGCVLMLAGMVVASREAEAKRKCGSFRKGLR